MTKKTIESVEAPEVNEITEAPVESTISELVARDATIASQEEKIMALTEKVGELEAELAKIRNTYPTIEKYSTEIPEPRFKAQSTVFHKNHIGEPFKIVSCGGVDRHGYLLYTIVSQINQHGYHIHNVPENHLSDKI